MERQESDRLRAEVEGKATEVEVRLTPLNSSRRKRKLNRPVQIHPGPLFGSANRSQQPSFQNSCTSFGSATTDISPSRRPTCSRSGEIRDGGRDERRSRRAGEVRESCGGIEKRSGFLGRKGDQGSQGAQGRGGFFLALICRSCHQLNSPRPEIHFQEMKLKEQNERIIEFESRQIRLEHAVAEASHERVSFKNLISPTHPC